MYQKRLQLSQSQSALGTCLHVWNVEVAATAGVEPEAGLCWLCRPHQGHVHTLADILKSSQGVRQSQTNSHPYHWLCHITLKALAWEIAENVGRTAYCLAVRGAVCIVRLLLMHSLGPTTWLASVHAPSLCSAPKYVHPTAPRLHPRLSP